MDDWETKRAAFPENQGEPPKPRLRVEDFLKAHLAGERPDPRNFQHNSARADAAPRRGELKQIKHTDPYSGSISYTYEGSKSAWMDPFKAVGYVQIKIRNSSATPTPAENAAALIAYRASHRDLKV